MNKFFSIGLGLLVLLAAATAQETSLVTITKVIKEVAVDRSKDLPQSSAKLPKFFDDDARRGETYAIYWAAPGSGLPAGVTVLFEYVLENAPDVYALHIQYDFKTEGPRKALFTIPEKHYRDGGNVKAWRVRIVLAGKLLAEQTAPNWKR
ncbi:MAG: hypothetical protein EPN23_07505 [Verrucomicrobia bacterium]|nr:MAG: hypothetical protein EPN23_07505 [Verrucomicrobiota bacterium]